MVFIRSDSLASYFLNSSSFSERSCYHSSLTWLMSSFILFAIMIWTSLACSSSRISSFSRVSFSASLISTAWSIWVDLSVCCASWAACYSWRCDPYWSNLPTMSFFSASDSLSTLDISSLSACSLLVDSCKSRHYDFKFCNWPICRSFSLFKLSSFASKLVFSSAKDCMMRRIWFKADSHSPILLWILSTSLSAFSALAAFTFAYSSLKSQSACFSAKSCPNAF